jgi:CubicO group peptidase (beta-lactamase class C family)
MACDGIVGLERLDAVLDSLLRTSRIPGAAIAVLHGDAIAARAYGFRDFREQLPTTTRTIFPIASTTKAMNATLLGMLVDEGLLSWDAPVQDYLPEFDLSDPLAGAQVTVRDLVLMRTGLSSNDFVWLENPITRAELVRLVRHLPMSGGFRERFQYSNLTPTIAGHVAEVVTGRGWDELMQQRIFTPIGMHKTVVPLPTEGNVTRFYHENRRRELILTQPLKSVPIEPAGGAVYSNVEDMARWMAFNLKGGHAAGRQLIKSDTLRDIHTPRVLMGADPAAPSPNAAYALGWFVDSYQGRLRLSHTGHLHDVHSSLMLFPQEKFGLVSYVNFASSRLATLINETAFDAMLGLPHLQRLTEALVAYEQKIANLQERHASMQRVSHTPASHSLRDYAGGYVHLGYGRIDIALRGATLILERGALKLALEHWHDDVWRVAQNDWFEIHKQQELDQTSLLSFETSPTGAIGAFTLPLDGGAARFVKQTHSPQENAS